MSEQKKNYYKFYFKKRPSETEKETDRYKNLPETFEKTCNLTDEQIELLKFLAKNYFDYYVNDWGPIKDITDFN